MLWDSRHLHDKKTAPHLSDPRFSLMKYDTPRCERVVKTFQTSVWRNKELRPVSDLSPSMLLYGTLSLSIFVQNHFSPLPHVTMLCDVIWCPISLFLSGRFWLAHWNWSVSSWQRTVRSVAILTSTKTGLPGQCLLKMHPGVNAEQFKWNMYGVFNALQQHWLLVS